MCGCRGKKKGETVVWEVNCRNTGTNTPYMTEVEARAASATCGKGSTYKRVARPSKTV